MAQIFIFPDHEAFDLACSVLCSRGIQSETIDPPEFAHGLVPPAALITSEPKHAVDAFRQGSVLVSGVLPYQVLNKDIPVGSPPNEKWKQALGALFISSVKPSITDPRRLRIELSFTRNLRELIPIIPNLIRGGAYNPNIPVFAFEEEHRLLAISENEVAICRVDDLLDMCVMVRCLTDLLVRAWTFRNNLKPEDQQRYGIGPIEIYKRLPATNCGLCNCPNCMEFAMHIFKGSRRLENCPTLNEPRYSASESSLRWLLKAIGLRVPHS